MKILAGSRIEEIAAAEFENIIKGYKALVMDIGTGEGEFVYKKAKQNPDVMYIGIDTSADFMRRYSLKACRKPERGGLRNLMYVIGNADALPDALTCTADIIYVNLPWGSLRDGIIKGEHEILSNIRKVSKTNASLEIYVGYSELYEKQKIESRRLPELSLSYLNSSLRAKYKGYGLNIVKATVLDNEDLKKLDTKWAKKLGFGKKRDIFYIKCKIEK